jgi:hypothetical protein
MTASTTTIAPTRIVPIRFCHSLMPAPPRNYTPPSSYPPFGPVCRILFECLEGPVFCVPCDVSGISAEGSISMTPKRAGCETGWSQKSMNWRLWLSGIAIAGLMMAGGVRSGAQAPSPATAPQRRQLRRRILWGPGRKRCIFPRQTNIPRSTCDSW